MATNGRPASLCCFGRVMHQELLGPRSCFAITTTPPDGEARLRWTRQGGQSPARKLTVNSASSENAGREGQCVSLSGCNTSVGQCLVLLCAGSNSCPRDPSSYPPSHSQGLASSVDEACGNPQRAKCLFFNALDRINAMVFREKCRRAGWRAEGLTSLKAKQWRREGAEISFSPDEA